MSVFGKWLYEIEKVDFYVKIDKKKKKERAWVYVDPLNSLE